MMKDNLFQKTTKDKTLHLVQELETGALVELDRICRKHDIDYSLGGGTCLGQIRHGGFIPWDDDIDVDMTIDNYERFMEIAQGELEGTEYYLLSRQTDPSYMRSHSRLCVKDTVMNQRTDVRKGHDRGLFIDIFCWNYIPNNRVLRRIMSTAQYYVRCAIKHYDVGSLEPTLSVRGRRTVNRLVRVMSLSRLLKIEDKLNHLYKKPTKWFLDDATVKGNFGGYPVEGMNDLEDVLFEGQRVRSKVNTDIFLRTMYGGGYSEWLPPAKRLSVHTWYQTDLGHYAEEAGLPEDYRECFTNAYTEEKLIHMKQLSYDMIERCAEICSKHGLKYYVVGHDLLFQALDAEEVAKMWTTPVKIAMPLKDYDVFRKVCGDELGERYYFLDYDGSLYEPPYGRVGLNYTHLREIFMPVPLENQMNTGFYIKIIPLAFTSNDEAERMQHRKRLNQLKKLIFIHWFKDYKVSRSNKENIKRVLVSLSGMEALHKKYDRELRKYSGTDWLIDGSSGELNRITVPADCFGEGTVCSWDGRSLVFPDKPKEIYDRCYSGRYEKTTENGKITVRRYSGDKHELLDVFTADYNQEEVEFIRRRFNNCLLNYYDLPECQLTVLRYDEKEDRLLSDEEIMGPDRR